jgi:hypothetical protein
VGIFTNANLREEAARRNRKCPLPENGAAGGAPPSSPVQPVPKIAEAGQDVFS